MKLTIVYGDDWEGLYRDGELLTQGHSISAEEALRELGMDVDSAEVDERWLSKFATLPPNLEDVKFIKE